MSDEFHESFVAVNGVRLHCVGRGTGPLMLFLHGFPEFWYAWKEQLQEFGRDHLAVAPDMRGYNLSDKPATVEQYRSKHLVEDIRALAAHFSPGRPFTLVAHDWGGAVAWAFAIRYPQLLERLIIINAPHPAVFSRLLSSDPAQQAASAYMNGFRSPGAEQRLSADGYSILLNRVMGDGLASGAFSTEDRDAYVKAWSQPGALTGGLNYYRANDMGPPLPGSAPAAADPSAWRVRVPTLVI
jgi:pimeloyl-ACP methyl ester carboxylesterase